MWFCGLLSVISYYYGDPSSSVYVWEIEGVALYFSNIIIWNKPIIIMNAQECRTLTATCMHIAWLTLDLCMLNIRSIKLHTLHLSRVLVYY